MADENNDAGKQPFRVGGRFAKRNQEPGSAGNSGVENGDIDAENTLAGSEGPSGEGVQALQENGEERTTADEQPKRRGGWPKGKPRGPRKGSASNKGTANRMDREAQSILTQQIVAFHTIAASATGIPELQISEFEAGLLAGSIADLTAHYGPVISGPAMLWISLAGVAGMIYVPRATSIAARMRKLKREKQTQPAQDNVIQGDFSKSSDDDPFAPGKVG